jgi:cytochrome c
LKTPFLGFVAASVLAAATPVTADHVKSSVPFTGGHGVRLVMPLMNPARGKALFVAKDCVACHAINGVGGHDAPGMDAQKIPDRLMNPFDFAAKMWNHAPAMIAAQEGAFGEQIFFTGEELADIISFIHNEDAQHTFTEKDLTPEAEKMMQHEHGGQPGQKRHAKEIGHKNAPAAKSGHPHAPGAKPHKD